MHYYGVPVFVTIRNAAPSHCQHFHDRQALLDHLETLSARGDTSAYTLALHIGNSKLVEVSAEVVCQLEPDYSGSSTRLCTALLRLATGQQLTDPHPV